MAAANPFLSVRTNVEDVLSAMDRKIEAAKTVATVRAVNKLRDQTETAGFRAINREYGIKVSDMRKYGRIRYEVATASNPQAAIIVGGVTFPLWLFPHRQTRAGIVVTLHGKQYLFPHAFMIKGRGDRKVYARGRYGSAAGIKSTGERYWNLQFGRGRFPISLLRTMSPRGVFAKDVIVEAMHARLREQSGKVLQQELRFAFRSVS